MKVILLVVLLILTLLLILGFSILVGKILVNSVLQSKKKCPVCKTEMNIKSYNIYTGQITYCCPKCGKEISYREQSL